MRPLFNVYQPWRREALLFLLQVACLGEGDAPVHALQEEGSQPQQAHGAPLQQVQLKISESSTVRGALATHHGGSPGGQQDLRIWLELPETEL